MMDLERIKYDLVHGEADIAVQELILEVEELQAENELLRSILEQTESALTDALGLPYNAVYDLKDHIGDIVLNIGDRLKDES